MSQFDITNFTESIAPPRDETPNIPAWVIYGSDTTKKVYEAILLHSKKIENKIESGKILAIKDRRIVARTVLKEVGLDPSYISQPAQKQLKEFLASQNEHLTSLWELKNKREGTSGKKLSKAQLEVEVTKLRKQYNDERNKNYRGFAEEVLNSHFLEEHANLARRNQELLKEVEELRSARATLLQKLAKYEVKAVK